MTKRYFPEWLLSLFNKDVPTNTQLGANTAINPEQVLRESGAIQSCEATNDICLTSTFRKSWYNRMNSLLDDSNRQELAAELLQVDSSKLSFIDHDEALVASYNGKQVGQWESREALVADVAASSELASRHDKWEMLFVSERAQVCVGLRVFLNECPSCGGPVSLSQDVVESCCHEFDVFAGTCEQCKTRFLETRGY